MLLGSQPTENNASARLQEARQVLRDNDRGGYTVPSAALYPFQWNWDSAVVALGWMEIDESRAWRELDRLVSGQWENGLIPHILFHQPSSTYFPGPEEWGLSHREVPSSSITQPPLLATMARMMWGRAKERPLADARCRALLPRIIAWHRWWYRDRDPEGTGLVVIYHPWESGMDNSPAWDGPLAAVPQTTRAYRRKDTSHVPAAQRPNQSDYDRFVYLLDFFREEQFDPKALYERCPFRVVDFALNAILLRATTDLACLCTWAGLKQEAAELMGYASRAKTALRGLWSKRLGQFVSMDSRTSTLLEHRTNSTFLAWFAGLLGPDGASLERSLLDALDEWSAPDYFVVPTTHPNDPAFDPVKYWRGPVWPHVNWLIALGLFEAGHDRRAERIRADTLRLIGTGGLKEYFNPKTGEGIGGERFSWTAAVLLLWSSPA